MILVSAICGFIPSYYDNHQAERDIVEIGKIEKYSQMNVYRRIVYDSLCMCVCVCVCLDYICVLLDYICVVIYLIDSMCV